MDTNNKTPTKRDGPSEGPSRKVSALPRDQTRSGSSQQGTSDEPMQATDPWTVVARKGNAAKGRPCTGRPDGPRSNVGSPVAGPSGSQRRRTEGTGGPAGRLPYEATYSGRPQPKVHAERTRGIRGGAPHTQPSHTGVEAAKTSHTGQRPTMAATSGSLASRYVGTFNRAGPSPGPSGVDRRTMPGMDEPVGGRQITAPPSGLPRPGDQALQPWEQGDKAKRRRECGAARRRKQMARQAAMAGASVPTNAPTKRAREVSDDTTDPANEPKKVRIQGSYKSALTSQRMAIVHAEHPSRTLGAKHDAEIRGFFFNRLLRTPMPIPVLTLGNMVGGALHVTCEGQASVDLLSTIDGHTIAGATVKVIAAKDLPKPVKMAWRTRTHPFATVAQVLGLIQRINPTLHTEEWKIVHVEAAGAFTRRIVLMDRTSADVIKAAGYTLHNGLGYCHYKLLDDGEPRKAQEQDEDPPEVPMDVEGEQTPQTGEGDRSQAITRGVAPPRTEGDAAPAANEELGDELHRIPEGAYHPAMSPRRASSPDTFASEMAGLGDLYLEGTDSDAMSEDGQE